MRIIPAWEAHSMLILTIWGVYFWRGVKNFAQNLEVASCSFEMSRLQALIWYIVVLVTLLVWVPVKLGYFLPHCCSTIIEELLPFDCLHFIFFSVRSHELASNRRNFMKLTLSIYDHSVMMHVKFHEDVIWCRGVIILPFVRLNINGFVHSEL